MKTMLDASGDLALWYTGEEIVVCDFGSNTECGGNGKMQEVKRPEFCLLLLWDALSRQSKAATASPRVSMCWSI